MYPLFSPLMYSKNSLENADRLLTSISEAVTWGSRCVKSSVVEICGFIYYDSICPVAKKTSTYCTENWQALVFIGVGLGVVFGGTGLMYGFKTVAIPLVFSFVGGALLGIVSGTIVAVWIDPRGEGKPNTIWGMINTALNGLNPNGVRQLVIASAIPVFLAVMVALPLVVGLIFGFVIGNHGATNFAHQKKLGVKPIPPQPDLTKEVEELKSQCADLSEKYSSLSDKFEDLYSKYNELTYESAGEYPLGDDGFTHEDEEL